MPAADAGHGVPSRKGILRTIAAAHHQINQAVVISRKRDPMYVVVSSLIFDQGLLFGNVPVLEYGFVDSLAFFAFLLLYKEPVLRRQFWKQYEEFCIRVPRWLPRIKR